jgi:O-antigen/teichoic acid export membrane protein
VLIGVDILITRRYTPSLAVRRSDFKKSAVNKLVADGVWSSANDLGALLHNGLDLAICNLMLTPLAMGQLAIAKSIDLIFHSLYHVAGHAFQPMLLRSYAENKMDRLLRELNLSMKFSALLSNLAFAGFFALGMVYYKLWIPNEDIALVYRLTVITVLTSVASGSMKPLYYIYTLTVKQKFPCVVTLITGALNVISMMVLLRFTDLGVYAVVWTTVVLVGFINFVSNPLYMAHVLRQPLTTFYPGIVRNVISCAALTLLFTGLSRLYLPASWLSLFACIAAYACIGAPVHFLIVLSREEKKLLLCQFKRRGGGR